MTTNRRDSSSFWPVRREVGLGSRRSWSVSTKFGVVKEGQWTPYRLDGSRMWINSVPDSRTFGNSKFGWVLSKRWCRTEKLGQLRSKKWPDDPLGSGALKMQRNRRERTKTIHICSCYSLAFWKNPYRMLNVSPNISNRRTSIWISRRTEEDEEIKGRNQINLVQQNRRESQRMASVCY